MSRMKKARSDFALGEKEYPRKEENHHGQGPYRANSHHDEPEMTQRAEKGQDHEAQDLAAEVAYGHSSPGQGPIALCEGNRGDIVCCFFA